MLDVVANNTDRKSGHCLLAGDRVWAIDNGLCFAPDFKLRTVIWEFAGEALTPAQLAAVDRAAPRRAGRGRRADRADEVEAMQRRAALARRARRAARRRQRRPLPVAAGLIDALGRWSRTSVLDGLIHRADLDGLVRLVDDCCAAATGRGCGACATGPATPSARAASCGRRRRWPSTGWRCSRRAEWAAGVLDEGVGRFTIGPLTEVVAQHHTWAELAPLLEPGPRAALVAHERALRGEAIDPASVAGLPDVLDLPVPASRAWEPRTRWPTYHDAGAEFPSPAAARRSVDVDVPAGQPGRVSTTTTVELAVRQLVEPWTASSNGHAEVVAVEGDAAGGAARARRAVGPAGAALTPAAAVAWLAWAGASGGAHGRRRGAAAGPLRRAVAARRARRRARRLAARRSTSSARSPPSCAGGGGTPTSRRPAGSCSWPSRTPPRGWPGRSTPATPRDGRGP